MDYLHVKNLEKYHPGYKDRDLKWFKCYFRTVNADPEFEMLCEIDKWRFVALIMLELQYQKPIPLDDAYFKRKGFDIKKRPMSLTLQMLQGSVEVVTGDEKPRSDSVTQIREEEEKEEEGDDTPVTAKRFLEYWNTKKRLKKTINFTEQRRKRLGIRLAEEVFVSRWVEVVDKLDLSDFATGTVAGSNGKKWNATIDWVLKNSTNYIKVLEGNYDNKAKDDPLERLAKANEQWPAKETV